MKPPPPIEALLPHRGKLAGAQIRMYGRTGGALLASGRGRMSGRELPLADPVDPKSPRGCWAQVYLDGMRIYSTKYGSAMAVPDLREIPVESLSGVEYYAGDAQTPSEFAGVGAWWIDRVGSARRLPFRVCVTTLSPCDRRSSRASDILISHAP